MCCLGGKSEGDAISSSPLIKTSKRPKSKKIVLSDSEEEGMEPMISKPLERKSGEKGGFSLYLIWFVCLVLCTSHVYHLRLICLANMSRIGGMSEGGAISSASVTKTSKKPRSKETVQSESEDDEMEPRTLTPLEGKSGEEGGLSFAF